MLALMRVFTSLLMNLVGVFYIEVFRNVPVILQVFFWSLSQLISWSFLDAVWRLEDRDSCAQASGACWAVIEDRGRLILFGLYTFEQQWRSTIACLAVIVTIILPCLPVFWSVRRLPILWMAGFGMFVLMMRGGFANLPLVTSEHWGGLSLTIFIFSAVVVIGMPLDVVLAFSVFYAVYQAEIIRAGLQSISSGQEEASKSMGMPTWSLITDILLPQAFRNTLPSTINQAVITFKETSIVTIIGFFEVMASGNAAIGTGDWSAQYVEVYVFLAFVHFVFVFGLSRYGA